VLIDGFVRATWKIARDGGETALIVKPLTEVSAEDQAAVTAEGSELLAFAAAGADRHEVRFVR
jgi:hypothetical protein